MPKPLQVRRTLEDIINYQNELYILVNKKIQNNSCLSFEERERFMPLFKRSVLSQGSIKCNYRTKTGTIVPFHHLTELAYFLCETTNNYIDIINTESGQAYEKNLPISQLWKFFELKLIYVFPYACDEGLHASAEAVLREAPSSFQFTAEKTNNSSK